MYANCMYQNLPVIIESGNWRHQMSRLVRRVAAPPQSERKSISFQIPLICRPSVGRPRKTCKYQRSLRELERNALRLANHVLQAMSAVLMLERHFHSFSASHRTAHRKDQTNKVSVARIIAVICGRPRGQGPYSFSWELDRCAIRIESGRLQQLAA